ncbi:MAG: cadherin domain-containing protein [Bacteroidota bacterium]
MKTLNIFTSTLFLTLLIYSCDKNEYTPEIVDQEFSIEENSTSGTIIGAVEASDSDEGQIISFEIIDGNSEGTFEIAPSTGILTVKDPVKLDYEENMQFILTIAVTDNHNKEPLESSAKVRINVTDENEFAPVMNNQTFDLDENPSNGQEIGIVQATDEDIHQNLNYSIIGQNDDNYIQIDSVTGSLSVLDSSGFDFESDQQLTIVVQVEDDHENGKAETATITVNILDVVEITDGLIAHYPFNGNANDVSGNEVHGQVNGAILTTDRYGTPDRAFLFDGIDDYITLSNADDLHFENRDFSISAWFELSSMDIKPQEIFTAYSSSGDNREFRFGANASRDSIFFKLYDDVGTVGGDMVWVEKPQGWNLVTVTKSSSSLKLFLNGVLIEETAVTANPTRTNARVMIGAVDKSSTSPDDFFDGKIDDVYIHSRVLEDWEIANLYQMK